MQTTTGIIRRIDELGRVVIPKEIRKTMRIKEGEELEVCVNGENTLLLKKYSPLKNFEKAGKEYAEILYKYTNCACYICSTDEITIVCGDKQIERGEKISKALENFLMKRKSGYFTISDNFQIVAGKGTFDVAIAPIIAAGDVIGGIILASKNRPMTDANKCQQLLDVAANFFARQTE